MRVVDEQMVDLDEQMTSLDDFVTRARSQNATHHDQDAFSLSGLSATVQDSYGSINSHFKDTLSRIRELEAQVGEETVTTANILVPLSENICTPLSMLREDILATKLQEYQPTGSTPQKVAYRYPTDLPHTKSHSTLINELHGSSSPSKASIAGGVFADADSTLSESHSSSRPNSSESPTSRQPLSMSLREVHPNVNTTTSLTLDAYTDTANTIHGFSASVGPGTMTATAFDNDNTLPMYKKSRITRAKIGKKASSAPPAGGRENMPPPPLPVVDDVEYGLDGEVFPQSASRRKSPRLH